MKIFLIGTCLFCVLLSIMRNECIWNLSVSNKRFLNCVKISENLDLCRLWHFLFAFNFPSNFLVLGTIKYGSSYWWWRKYFSRRHLIGSISSLCMAILELHYISMYPWMQRVLSRAAYPRATYKINLYAIRSIITQSSRFCGFLKLTLLYVFAFLYKTFYG